MCFQLNFRPANKEPDFFDKIKSTNKPEEPKKNDFWGNILDDKPKQSEPAKPAAFKPAPQPITTTKVGTYNDVASLDDEFILD